MSGTPLQFVYRSLDRFFYGDLRPPIGQSSQLLQACIAGRLHRLMTRSLVRPEPQQFFSRAQLTPEYLDQFLELDLLSASQIHYFGRADRADSDHAFHRIGKIHVVTELVASRQAQRSGIPVALVELADKRALPVGGPQGMEQTDMDEDCTVFACRLKTITARLDFTLRILG